MRMSCCEGGTWWNIGGTHVPPKTERYIEINHAKMKRWNISPIYTALTEEKNQNTNDPGSRKKVFSIGKMREFVPLFHLLIISAKYSQKNGGTHCYTMFHLFHRKGVIQNGT